MPSVMMLKSLEDTTLWKRLNEGFKDASDEDIAKELAVNLKHICKEASYRMKAFPSLHTYPSPRSNFRNATKIF